MKGKEDKPEQEMQEQPEAPVKTPVQEFDRCINALALELHKPVWDDVNKLWNEVKAQFKSVPQSAGAAAEIEQLKRLLHDLTPGGSEFHNDPERCAKWIKESRQQNHYLLAGQIKQLKVGAARYREALEKYGNHLSTCNINQNWHEGYQAMADTPNGFRDEGYYIALEEMNTKRSKCTCGFSEALPGEGERPVGKEGEQGQDAGQDAVGEYWEERCLLAEQVILYEHPQHSRHLDNWQAMKQLTPDLYLNRGTG